MSAFKLLLVGLTLTGVAAAGLVLPGSAQATAAPVVATHGGTGRTTGAFDISDPITPTETLTAPETPTIPSIITSTVPVTTPSKIAAAITSYFSGTAVIGSVIEMHAQGMGFGEIFRMYQLALAAGKTPEEITAMRRSGMGWGEIAHELSVPPGNKGANLGAAVSGRKTPEASSASALEPQGREKTPPGLSGGSGNKPEAPAPGGSKTNGNENGNPKGNGSNGSNNSQGKGKGK